MHAAEIIAAVTLGIAAIWTITHKAITTNTAARHWHLNIRSIGWIASRQGQRRRI